MSNPNQPALLSVNQVNYLNIGLMLCSVALAWYKPFEVFFFSFLILGPLHYFTEISWLDKRNYFGFSRNQFLLFVPVSFFITLGGVIPSSPVTQYAVSLFCACMVYSFTATQQPNVLKNILIFVITVLVIHASGLDKLPFIAILTAVLMPTIVHVLVFTGVFILSGIKKKPTFSGVCSGITFVLSIFLLLFLNPFGNTDAPEKFYMDFYKNMGVLNSVLSNLFNIGSIHNFREVFTGDAAYRIMSLISFAYLYHYLNWFSKTEIIGWHRVSKKRLLVIGLLWLGVLGLYFVDNKTGLNLILFFSLLHVLLELPLNILSVKELFSFNKT